MRLTAFLLFIALALFVFPQTGLSWPLEDDVHKTKDTSLLTGEEAESMAQQLRKKLGDSLQSTRLFLYGDRARVLLQDGDKKGKIVEYGYQGGSFTEPRPVDFMRKDIDFSKLLFPLNDIDFSKIPSITEAAQKKLNLKEGAVTHVMIGRDFVDDGELSLRVFVQGKDQEGHVDAAPDGSLKTSKVTKRLKYELDPPKLR